MLVHSRAQGSLGTEILEFPAGTPAGNFEISKSREVSHSLLTGHWSRLEVLVQVSHDATRHEAAATVGSPLLQPSGAALSVPGILHYLIGHV